MCENHIIDADKRFCYSTHAHAHRTRVIKINELDGDRNAIKAKRGSSKENKNTLKMCGKWHFHGFNTKDNNGFDLDVPDLVYFMTV